MNFGYSKTVKTIPGPLPSFSAKTYSEAITILKKHLQSKIKCKTKSKTSNSKAISTQKNSGLKPATATTWVSQNWVEIGCSVCVFCFDSFIILYFFFVSNKS